MFAVFPRNIILIGNCVAGRMCWISLLIKRLIIYMPITTITNNRAIFLQNINMVIVHMGKIWQKTGNIFFPF